MFAVRPLLRLVLQIVFWMLAITALAQNDDIFQRLRHALAPSGQGELAVAALAKKNFEQVEEILAQAKAPTEAARAELLSLDGAVNFLDGKTRAAAVAFCEAAKLAPLTDTDSFTLAMAWIKLGDDVHARALLASL